MVRITNRKAAAGVGAVVLLALAAGAWFTLDASKPTPESYYKKLSSRGGSFANAFEDSIPTMVPAIGASGAMEVIAMAEKSGKISVGNCHPLIHLVGHETYKLHLERDPILIKKYATICQAALEHGIEAEMVFEEVDPVTLVNDLHAQCAYLQQYVPGYPCYHGAGHAFYQLDPHIEDTSKVLARCDTIGPPSEVGDCYRGVFSEILGRVVGYDGETGLPVPGPKTVLTPAAHPLAFCYTLGTQYQDACITQLTPTTFGSTTYQGGGDFSGCTYSGYDALTQKECVHITANQMGMLTMVGTSTYRFPPAVTELSPTLQKAAIDGIKELAVRYTEDGFTRTWGSGCAIFSGTVAAYCRSQLQ